MDVAVNGADYQAKATAERPDSEMLDYRRTGSPSPAPQWGSRRFRATQTPARKIALRSTSKTGTVVPSLKPKGARPMMATRAGRCSRARDAPRPLLQTSPPSDHREVVAEDHAEVGPSGAPPARCCARNPWCCSRRLAPDPAFRAAEGARSALIRGS